jgi:uncharacterized membrane protein
MNQAAGIHHTNAGYDRSMEMQRWIGILGGSALIGIGLSRRTKSGAALAGAGGLLALSGMNAVSLRRPVVARSTMIVNAPADKVYAFWRDLENLPRFMHHLESVTVLGNKQSRWVAIGPLGKKITWTAEITNERPNESISWQSVPNSELNVKGTVEFRPATGKRGTFIDAMVHFEAPAGALGSTVAKYLGKDPNFIMRQDLRRLKELIETGEIPTVEGQTHGPRSVVASLARVVDPDRPIRGESKITEVVSARRRAS